MGNLGSTFGVVLASAEGGHGPLTFVGLFAFIALVLVILFGMMSSAKKGLNNRVFTKPITQKFEQLYLFVENMCIATIGAHGRKYIPMIMTLWLVIFMGNMVALFIGNSPTADLSFNVAMALICVGYVQYEGMRANGVLGHFKHFSGPKLGGLLALFVTPLIFSIEIISELMKNVSLSLRLYGNIHGGHQAVEAMNKLGESIYVPVGAFLLPIKLLTVIVQALIFTLLTCVYLSLVTHHDEGHEGEAAHAH